MPCRTDYPYFDYNQKEVERQKNSNIEAMLCQLTKIISTVNNLYPYIKTNWNIKECGVTFKQYEKWWKEHQEKDRKRLEKEEKEKKRLELKKNGLSKLTDEEKEALGIK